MIEDERGLVKPQIFKRMFFTYFKGEKFAYQVFEMLEPCISIYFDSASDEFINQEDARANEDNRFVHIQLLTKFIDLFNYYPVQVNKLRYKNDSNEFTYIMNSGVHGSKNERGEVTLPKPLPKTVEEKKIIDLLALVSSKITERFKDLQTCFRHLDTNHS